VTTVWCPRCEAFVDMDVVAGSLFVCALCGRSFTPLELQELAYDEGYEDCLVDVEEAVRRVLEGKKGAARGWRAG
jgi:transposase-like protein